MFQGSAVALVTPMQKDGTIDKQSLHDLVDWHLASKTDCLVVVGTTGEATTLTLKEQSDVIKNVIKQVNKKIPVIAGTGSNSTAHTLELTQNAEQLGVDGCLIVTPYYNKPTQNGLFEHYKFIAEKTSRPIILYNVPGRTCCDLLPETIGRLSKLKNIVGVKEATGKIERCEQILNECEKFMIYSGDDATGLDLMKLGAKGVISVTANIAPQKMSDMCQAIFSGDTKSAEKLNQELMPLHTKLFLEANPIPVKWALNKMGRIPEGIRLPLTQLGEKFHKDLEQAMQAAGVLN